jgi:hypothetical protein
VRVRDQAAPDRATGDNGCVLQMRLAQPLDKVSVARVVAARCDWMEARGLPSWRGAADDLVAQCDNLESDVWVLDDEAAGVIGQTVLQEQGPPFGWTEAERAESALYLSGSDRGAVENGAWSP